MRAWKREHSRRGDGGTARTDGSGAAAACRCGGGPSQDASARVRRLDAELDRLCLRRLLSEWVELNFERLDGALRLPMFRLAPFTDRLGQWDASSCTISLSRDLVYGYPWGAVLEVLRHEMAHQVVSELMGDADRAPHGALFESACKLLGIEPAARYDPLALFRTESVSERTGAGEREAARLRKIKRLLALAESPNEHEAQAALAKANELLLRYNLDLVEADRAPQYCVRQLGRVTQRRSRIEKLLGTILCAHFFCEAVWVWSYSAETGREGYVLEIMGRPENVALAAYTYEELQRSAEHLWRLHKRERGLRGDRLRRRYIEGVLVGFKEKLGRERKRLHEEHALVWRGDLKLQAFVARRHGHLVSGRFSLCADATFQAGRQAGQGLELRRAMPEQRGAGSRGLALPGGR